MTMSEKLSSQICKNAVAFAGAMCYYAKNGAICAALIIRVTIMKRLLASSWCGVLVSLTGLLLMLFGIYRGELAVVLQKAINICLECIGIG